MASTGATSTGAIRQDMMAGFSQLAKIISFTKRVILVQEETEDYDITKGLINLIDAPSTGNTDNSVWNSQLPVITAAVVCAAVLTFSLGLIILSAILYARRKLTTFDVLIVNHLFIDLITVVWIAPVALLFNLVTASEFTVTNSMHTYFTWQFLPGMVHRAAGMNLLVLSLHQIGSLMCALIPTSSIVAFIQRHRRRNVLSALLLGVVWLMALVSELLFLAVIHGAVTRDGNEPASHAVLHVLYEIQIVVSYVLPSTISIMILIYIAVFGVCFRPAFRRIITETASNQSVSYSPSTDVHDDMPDRAKLLDFNENGQLSPSDVGQQIFFENTVIGDTIESNAGVSNGQPGEQSGDGEFSRDSLKALLMLTSLHFFLLTVFDFVTFYVYFSLYAVEIQIVLAYVKGVADFLVLLLLPRYRAFLLSGWHRFRDLRWTKC